MSLARHLPVLGLCLTFAAGVSPALSQAPTALNLDGDIQIRVTAFCSAQGMVYNWGPARVRQCLDEQQLFLGQLRAAVSRLPADAYRGCTRTLDYELRDSPAGFPVSLKPAADCVSTSGGR